jgi:hypothetical protein
MRACVRDPGPMGWKHSTSCVAGRDWNSGRPPFRTATRAPEKTTRSEPHVQADHGRCLRP